MAGRRVTQTRKNNQGDITALCNPAESWSPRRKVDAISDIESNAHTYYVDRDGHRTNVHVVDGPTGKYLRTTADSGSANNLDNIPSGEAEQLWQDRKGVAEEKLRSDVKFKKKLLVDARAALAEERIPYTRAASRVLPPPLPDEHATFFATVDSDMAFQKWAALSRRAFDDSDGSNHAQFAGMRQRLGATGFVADGGGLTEGAKNLVAQVLQDPEGWLQSLAVAPSVEDRQFIFPSFSETHANAFADWMSMTLAGKPPELGPERRAEIRELRDRIANDADLLFRWLTKPAKTYQEIYPKATARDIANLPSPMLEDEAKQIIASRAAAPTSSTERTTHNSSDLVIGFRMELLNKLLNIYFTTLAPEAERLPRTFSADVGTTHPPPDDIVHCEFTIAQPGDLRILNVVDNRLAATSSGAGFIVLGDQRLSFELELTPIYTILLKDGRVYLKILNVDVVFTANGAPDPTLGKSTQTAIEQEIQRVYPDGEIYLLDQRPIDMNIPLADVEVVLETIEVHDDLDSSGSGELFFGITIDDKEYLFGQFDADSGSNIQLGQRFLLKKGGAPFSVQARGVDMDWGMWPDQDDDLGSAMNVHSASAPGTYVLEGNTPIASLELVWDIVDTVLRVFCWLVEVFIAFFNGLFSRTGFQLAWDCTSWRESVMGWLPKPKTTLTHTYTLHYRVTPLEPMSIAISFPDYKLFQDGLNDGLYLTFDLAIPGILDGTGRKKTSAFGFTGPADVGIAISENLLDKVLRAWWTYSPIMTTVTTPYGGRPSYAHVEFDLPEISLQPSAISLDLSISGSAGGNVGFFYPRIAMPARAHASARLFLENRQLEFLIDDLRFSQENVFESLLNVAAAFAINFPFGPGKAVMNLSHKLRLGLDDSAFLYHPSAQLLVNPEEIRMFLSTDVAPAISVDPFVLDYGFESYKTVVVTNAGNATLWIHSLSIENNVFTFSEPWACPFPIAPKKSVVVQVQIDPAWSGDTSGRLIIASNDPALPSFPIAMHAHDCPRIDLEPRSVGFGEIASRHATIAVRNIGHTPLTVSRVRIANDAFSIVDPPATWPSIDPGNTFLLDIECTATTDQTGSLTIESDDPISGAVTVPLSASFPIPTLVTGPIGVGFGGFY
jgi:hypothetical protein